MFTNIEKCLKIKYPHHAHILINLAYRYGKNKFDREDILSTLWVKYEAIPRRSRVKWVGEESDVNNARNYKYVRTSMKHSCMDFVKSSFNNRTLCTRAEKNKMYKLGVKMGKGEKLTDDELKFYGQTQPYMNIVGGDKYLDKSIDNNEYWKDKFDEILGSLDDFDKFIILSHYQNGYTDSQIAEMIGRGRLSVMRRRKKVVGELKKKFSI